jgi:hypothetical protein
LRIKSCVGVPIPGIPASDIWLYGCNSDLELCGGANSINADSSTNGDGRTTISGQLASGGCDPSGVIVLVQGIVVTDSLCMGPLCLPVAVKSPDITGSGAVLDGVVDVVDLAEFAKGYASPPKPYTQCFDFNCDGYVDIVDFSIFAQHYGHACL